ncbi:MAG: 30S ribosomal protein S20 [Chthoniobacterales bacterium]|nr:MAG: 30S ribosomal protein S20 [Chthoniobacterales bacterium]
MANTKSAAKRARQTQRRSLRNRSVLSRLRSLQKRAIGANAQPADRTALISAIDKAAKRGIIHRNAATRRKTRLTHARPAAL